MKQFECKRCEITLLGWKDYASHCENVHNEKIAKIAKARELIDCNSCDEKFAAPCFYIKHHQTSAFHLTPI